MTKNIFRICAILALGFAASQTALRAQGAQTLVGTWAVNVTVVDCQSGAPIRTVHSLQMMSRDGSLSETANTFLRGSSVGVWTHTGGLTYGAAYWFYRYHPDGTFASTAQAVNSIQLGPDGNHFSTSATIQDFDANGVLLSTGCVSQTATRLSGPGLAP